MAKQHSPHFFDRDQDGTTRVRLKFQPDEVALFEEAAGDTPVIPWIYRTLHAAAKRQVKATRAERAQIGPPE